MSKQKNQRGPKKKSHKVLWIVLGIVAVIVVLIVVLAVRGIQDMSKKLTSVMDNTAEAFFGEIAVTTEGIGVVETADATTIYTDYPVKLQTLYKKDGEQVAAGEPIAAYESLLLDETIASLEERLKQLNQTLAGMNSTGSTRVTAPVSGHVKEIYAKEGDSVLTLQKQQPGLALIAADGRMKTEIALEHAAELGQKVVVLCDDSQTDGYIQQLDGQTAQITFEDGERYELGKEVTVQTADGTRLGSGTIAISQGVYVSADSGEIKSVSVERNQRVSAGSTLFRLQNVSCSEEYLQALKQQEELTRQLKEAEEYKKGFVVTAEADAIVSNLTAAEGETLPAGTALCRLLNPQSYQVILNIDELDIQGVAAGQPVEVTVDAQKDRVYEGTVSGISLVGENNGSVGTYEVRVLLKEADGLLYGMSANGKITKEQKQDVLLVPVDTIQTVDGKKCVTVVKEDGTHESREVTLGLVNNEYAEVQDGVQEGEKLQVIVKLTDLYSQMGISVDSNQE